MLRSSLRARILGPGCALVTALAANAAAAQTSAPGAAPESPAPVAPPPTAAPGSVAPAVPPPSGAPSAAPGEVPPPPPQQPLPPSDVVPQTPPPPPPPPPGAAPGEPPYPPPSRRYGRLGGDPEPPIQPGSWDPWANPVPGRFSHDGFFLRLNIGPGYASVSRPDTKWTGLGLGMGLSVGGSLVENLALHADFHTSLVSSPTQRDNGRKSEFDADIVFESMGLGLTYYLMPLNIYATISGGIGVLVFEDDESGASKDTEAGLTLSATIGKEWWVGSDWGLGIAGQALYIRVKDYVDDARMNGLVLNVLFSATYN